MIFAIYLGSVNSFNRASAFGFNLIPNFVIRIADFMLFYDLRSLCHRSSFAQTLKTYQIFALKKFNFISNDRVTGLRP
jgi:hypothetical protein